MFCCVVAGIGNIKEILSRLRIQSFRSSPNRTGPNKEARNRSADTGVIIPSTLCLLFGSYLSSLPSSVSHLPSFFRTYLRIPSMGESTGPSSGQPSETMATATRTTPTPMGPPPKPAQRKAPMIRGGGASTSDHSMDESTASDRFQDRDSPGSQSYSASELGEEDGWHSDWSNYGDVPDVLDEYDRAVELIDGSDSWNWEQRQVHQLIYMRGIHPMIPSWWRMSFKMWGIDQPQLDHVFTPRNCKKRVVISAWGNEVAGRLRRCSLGIEFSR